MQSRIACAAFGVFVLGGSLYLAFSSIRRVREAERPARHADSPLWQSPPHVNSQLGPGAKSPPPPAVGWASAANSRGSAAEPNVSEAANPGSVATAAAHRAAPTRGGDQPLQPGREAGPSLAIGGDDPTSPEREFQPRRADAQATAAGPSPCDAVLEEYEAFKQEFRGQRWTTALATEWLERLRGAIAADGDSSSSVAAHRTAAHICLELADVDGAVQHLHAAIKSPSAHRTERVFALQSLARLKGYSRDGVSEAMRALDQIEAEIAALEPEDLRREWTPEAERLIFDRANLLNVALINGADPADLQREFGVLPSDLYRRIAAMSAEERARLSLTGTSSDYLVGAAESAVREGNRELAAELYLWAIVAPDRDEKMAPATFIWDMRADALYPGRSGEAYLRELENGEASLPRDAWWPMLSHRIVMAQLSLGRGREAAARLHELLEGDAPEAVAWRTQHASVIPRLLSDLVLAYGQEDNLDFDAQHYYGRRLITEFPNDPLALQYGDEFDEE